jgi:hypothetical protein
VLDELSVDIYSRFDEERHFLAGAMLPGEQCQRRRRALP